MKTLQISDESYEKVKDQLEIEETFDMDSYDDLIGKKFFFRTVTYHYTGQVTKITGQFLHLKDSAWIADSGRFMNAIKNGKLDEVEPIGEMCLNLQTVIDLIPWKHKLPKEQS